MFVIVYPADPNFDETDGFWGHGDKIVLNLKKAKIYSDNFFIEYPPQMPGYLKPRMISLDEAKAKYPWSY